MEGQYTQTDTGIENPAFQLQEQVQTTEKEESRHFTRNSHQSSGPQNGQIPKRKKSLMQLTKEALPRLENYRNSRKAVKRPSLGQLHGGEDVIAVSKFISSLYSLGFLFGSIIFLCWLLF